MKIKVQGAIPKHIMDEVEKLKPSAEPAYWAKSGCKDCAGRGVIGTQTTTIKGNNKFTQSLLCSCTRKKYRAWVEKTAEEVKAKLVGVVEKVSEVTPGSNGNGGEEKKDQKEQNLRSRLVSLEDAIANIKIEIARENNEINSHPHIRLLEEIGARRQLAGEAMQDSLREIEALDKKAIDLLERSQRLMTAAKSLARDASVIQKERDDLTKSKVTERSVVLQTIQAEYRAVEKDFNAQTHKAKRRRRIAEDRLDKLMERRQRIIRESGFDPVSFVESMSVEHDG